MSSALRSGLPLDGNCIVVGLGSTGLSTLNYLKRAGVSALAYDQSRPANDSSWLQKISSVMPIEDCFFAEEGKSIFADADCVFLSPGIAPDADWLADWMREDCLVSGDLDLFADAVTNQDADVIAITGSNAKSTVTTLVAKIIEKEGRRVAVGGNLGTPMLDLIDDDVEVYVLELSSFQLERSRGLRGHTACILNISPDHLDRHKTMQSYQAQKQKIYSEAACKVFFSGDIHTYPQVQDSNGSVIGFGEEASDSFRLLKQRGRYVVQAPQKQLFDDSEINIKGSHNLMNLAAACALSAGHAGADSMREVCMTFSGLPHRSEYLGEVGGVSYVNDSKATNVGAALAALKGVSEQSSGSVYLIAGGVGKGADFGDLTDFCRASGASLILLGQAATAIASSAGVSVELLFAEDLGDAVDIAQAMAMPGDVVLLAPACASFDMFDNYVARGEAFRAEFQRLLEDLGVADKDLSEGADV